MKKRTISSIVSFTMLLSTAPMVMADWTQRADVDLRVGILGDVHLQPTTYGGEDKLKMALEATKALSGGDIDVMALTGDVVFQDKTTNYSDHYDKLYENLNTYVPNIPIVYAMGNHEYIMDNHTHSDSEEKRLEAQAIFTEKTSQPVNYHYETADGYHFIAAAADNYNGVYSDETQNWLMTEIDKAIAEDVNKPVFVLLHHPVDNTVVDNTYEGYNDTFEAYIKTKPQVINLTAHKHVAAQIPQTIYQDGFTAFQTPMTAIGQTNNWKCNAGPVVQVYQGAMIEVTDNVVSIYKYDLETQEYIGEPWVIDIPAIVADRADDDTTNDNDHLLYSADKRSNPKTPVWGENATVSVKKRANGAEIIYPNNATVEAQENQQDGFVAGYKVEVSDTDNNVLFSNIYPADYYLPEESRAETYTQTVTGLGYSRTFNINVYPMTPWKTFGLPLSSQVTTLSEAVSDRTITYEFEDVADTDVSKSTITESTYASDGGILASGSGYCGVYLGRGKDPSFDFTINVPADDTYTIEYALGQQGNTATVSAVELTLEDGTVIGKNDKNYSEDLSMGTTYPWKYIPLRKYKTELPLTAGEHTVTLTVKPCQVNAAGEGLYFFAADYIRLTPNTITYPEGTEIIDLIRDENGALRTGVSASSDFPAMQENLEISSVIDGDNSTFWFTKFDQTSPNITVDLGGVKAITSISYLPTNGFYGNVENGTTDGWYWRAGMEIQLSNSKNFDSYVCVASIPNKAANALDLGQALDVTLDGSINKYRYVRISQPNCSVVGACEISVNGYELSDDDYSDVKVESVSFTSTPDAVTNIDTQELIEINFNGEFDEATVTSDNIYLTDASGNKQEINPIIIDSNTIGIYPGELKSYTTYNVIATGLMDKIGAPIATYASADTFTTSQYLVPAEYIKGTIITDVAAGKPVTATGTIANIHLWTDNSIASGYSLVNQSTAEVPVYGTIDLGAEYDIIAVGIVGNGGIWQIWTTEVYADTISDSTMLTSFVSADIRKDTPNNTTMKSAQGKASKIIVQKTAGGEACYRQVSVYARVDATPVTIKNTANVIDGMTNVTNISNSSDTVDSTYMNNTYVVKPMEIILSDNADMSTVSNTTLTINDGTKDITYTPVVDGNIVKIDLAELASYSTYTVTLTNGVKSLSGFAAEGDSFTFTTGPIAKVAYAEGKVIKNIAINKTAYRKSDGSSLSGWTNGRGVYDAQGANVNWLKNADGDFGIVDLGREYENISAVGIMSTSSNWHYAPSKIYGTNDASCIISAATLIAEITTADASNTAVVPGASVKHTVLPVTSGKYRYILFKPEAGDGILGKEVFVYASIDENTADVFFTTDNTAGTVTANVENGGNNKLILASYDASNNLGEIVFGEGGKASLTKADGYTYKAFLWDSLEKANPVTEALKY